MHPEQARKEKGGRTGSMIPRVQTCISRPAPARQPEKRKKFLSPFPGVTVAVALQLPADRAAPYELAHEDSSS